MKKVSRRQVIKAGVSAATLVAAGCATKSATEEVAHSVSRVSASEPNTFEFIVVGSGAGGGPLAGRLAQAGFSVLLLEAGDDNPGKFSPIPVAHGRAADDPAINWNFFVQRYDKSTSYDQQSSKAVKDKGIYYPRASTLGGCTTVNAMLHLYPDDKDWNNIARLTGDSSWNHEAMYGHYNTLRNKVYTHGLFGHIQLNSWSELFSDAFRSDFRRGWLSLSQAPIQLLFQDKVILNFVLGALREQGLLSEISNIDRQFGNIKLDPNIREYIEKKYNGLYNIPINQVQGKRTGVREYLLEVQKKYPNLTIRKNALCKKLVFDDRDPQRIAGVEYVQGSHVYRASHTVESSFSQAPIAIATKEVIVSGGAFNSPQLLMLSGIGDDYFLKEAGIQTRVSVPGVGRNLQDRYEVSVISELNAPIELIKDCQFGADPDPCLAAYQKDPFANLYSTNGVSISMITRSSAKKETPDLNIFGVPGYFKGYYPMWSKDAYRPNFFTWAILKGHTNNLAGYVRLRKNSDFRDMPEINFRYFDDGSPGSEDDLLSVVNGIKKARGINSQVNNDTQVSRGYKSKDNGGIIKKEVYPNEGIQTDEQLRQWIKQEAWGHHASCSNKMGRFETDPYAVVDSQFRVRGVKGLRVVDASVFPNIPGLFIVLPTLIISEKAAQSIIDQYRG